MASGIAITLVLGCALLGGYASMFTSHQHGYLEALRICTTNNSYTLGQPCVLDMSDSVTRSITGNTHVDDLINILLEFFSQGLRTGPDTKGIDLEALLAFVYLAAQFGGAWYIIALEGLRLGNRGTILSWTGLFGIVFQSVTITIIAPIYLTIQMLLSPSTFDPSALLADPCDLALLPVSAVVSYIVPTVGLCLPLLNAISGDAKLLAVALWQPFPLYHTAIRGLSQLFCRTRRGKDNNKAHINPRECSKALSRANKFICALTIGVHVSVMGFILASAATEFGPSVSGHHILALTSLTNPPTLAMFDPPVSAMDSREIVVSFLRWDVYCTCASMLVWSVHQLRAVPGAKSLPTISVKALIYALLGGPIFPSLMLLWDRDEMAMKSLELVGGHKKVA